jgi:hypothetical protein
MGVPRRIVMGGVLFVALLCAPGAAGAATLTFTGQIDPTDPTLTPVGLTTSTSGCPTAPASSFPFVTANYDAYALRNTGADDCVTVTLIPQCGEWLIATTYLGTFAPKDAGTNIVGAAPNPGCEWSGGINETASIPAGRTFVVAANGFRAADQITHYWLFVTGSSLAVAQAVNVHDGGLPSSNTLNIQASSLQDGSAPEGTVSVTAASGQNYSGSVTCLRVDGDRASLLMTITGGNSPAKFKGAVYWLEETPSGFGSQRNTRLTQAQLDAYGGACPDPSAPLRGAVRPMSSGYASVIDTPAPEAS